MKRVPFKCRFGHITIIIFYSDTAGHVVCEACKLNAGMFVRKRNAKRSWVKYREIAERI